MDLNEFRTEMAPYNPDEERKAFIQRTKDEGFDVVIPKDNELQIDIDNDEQYAVFERAMHSLSRNEVFSPLTYEEHPSRSGLPRRHITVTLPRNVDTPWMRIALQASLGSDPIRELISCIRLIRGDMAPTLFVEKRNP